MYRSLVTFATTEAAAIAALLASPSTTALCSTSQRGSVNPSTRQTASSTATWARQSASAARLVTWRPRASIPLAHRAVTATRDAAFITLG